MYFFENNRIKYSFFERPNIQKIKNLDEIDKMFLEKEDSEVIKDKKLLDYLYSDNSECLEFINKISMNKIDFKTHNNGKYRILDDCNYGNLYNVENGYRKTCFIPNNAEQFNTIWFYGPCIIAGYFTSDSYTIPSQLQLLVNKEKLNFKSINCSSGGGRDHINDFERMINSKFASGDLVI